MSPPIKNYPQNLEIRHKVSKHEEVTIKEIRDCVGM